MLSERCEVIINFMRAPAPHMLRLEAKALSQHTGAEAREQELFRVNIDWEGSSIKIIMGESGVGKSTLLKTLGGVWRPQRGSLQLNGLDLWSPQSSKQNPYLLSKIGFCFQNNALFNSMSCLENLCFAHRKRFSEESEQSRRDLAQKWLKRVELHQVESLLPHEISGGMQKRLSIARTLMLNPEIIFFDDPTAGLDPITSRQIIQLLQQLLLERPALSIVVTNDEDRARQLGKTCFVLEDGKLHERELGK